MKVFIFILAILAGYSTFRYLKQAKISWADQLEETRERGSAVVLRGLVTNCGKHSCVLTTDGGTVSIVSTTLDLEEYLEKKVKVTGMYSGSSLYVDHIRIE